MAALGAAACSPAPASQTGAGSPGDAPKLAPAGGELGFAPEARVGVERIFALRQRGTIEVDNRLLARAVAKTMSANSASGDAQPAGSLPPQAGRLRSAYDLSATLHTRVVASDETGFVVAARLRDVAYSLDGHADPRREMMEAPFMMTFDRTGALREIDFVKKYPTALGGVLRGLVEPLQVIAGSAGKSSWEANEREGGSIYAARYQLAGSKDGLAALSKTRTRVVRDGLGDSGAELPGQHTTDIEKSETKIEWSEADRAIERMTTTERVVVKVGKAQFSMRDGVFTAARVRGPLAELAETLDAAKAALDDRSFARARMYDVHERYAAKLAGLDAPGAIAAFRATAKLPVEGLGLIKNFARMQPAASEKLARALDAVVTDEHVGFGWTGLAAAGHVEAQKVLADVIRNASYDPISREMALIGLMDVELPEPFLLDAVWAFRQDVAKSTGAASLHVSMALNTFGALGDVEKGDPETTKAVVAKLAGDLASADVRIQALALVALSNVGDEGLVEPLAAPFFASADERLRSRAFGTFRRFPGAGAFEAFAKRYQAESSVKVLRDAARVAFEMPESDARHAWARSVAPATTDSRTLRQLVKILGKGKEAHPENEQVLRALLAAHTDRNVRRAIYAYVSPSVSPSSRGASR